MKKQSLTKSILLTLVGLGVLATHTNAATTAYSTDDLFIGFFDQSHTATQDYLVNLGQAAAFRDATPGSIMSLGSFNTDLTTTFGSDWQTNQDVRWFVFGGTHLTPVGIDPNYTLYIGGARNDVNTPFSPYTVDSQSTQAGIAGQIKSVGNAYFKNNGSVQTLTASGGLIQTSTQTNSLYSFSGLGGTLFGGYGTADFGTGTADSVIDLFRMPGDIDTADFNNPVYGSNVGKFTINDAGTVIFTAPSAVPEPSVYGLIIGAGLLLLVLRRSRKSQLV